MTDLTVSREDVSLDLADRLLDGVRAEAESRGVAMGAAVVDLGGQVVAAMRMDGAQLVALPLAIDKAYTAVGCGLPSHLWAERSQPGGPDWGLNTTLGGRFVVFAGGMPITVEGRLVGGLGVSGAAADIDQACADAALAAAGLSTG
ncbi:heme-binding protein [Streptosporangium sp. NPDC051022]|uniref:GlcG/HbpS family heme-binding protein n=1 Tax=Streptosporangium sp. NPDC051022 TaxID=3155752 RepID=UPI00344A5557